MAGLEPGKMVTSFTLGSRFVGGWVMLLSAMHSWGRQVGMWLQKSVERSGLLAAGRKIFIIEQIYNKCLLKWWSICSWSMTAGFARWPFFALKPTPLTFPVFSHPLFSFLRTIPSVLPRIRMQVGKNGVWLKGFFSALRFKEKKIIHKAPSSFREWY